MGIHAAQRQRQLSTLGQKLRVSLEFDETLCYHNIREALEKAMYENADMDRNKKCVANALEEYETLLDIERQMFLDS